MTIRALNSHRAFRRQNRRRGRRAFTLLETSLAIVIVGVGVLAMLEAQQAFLVKNAWSTQSTTASLLASEIRELTRTFPRHDVFSGGLYFENPDTESGFSGWGPEANELLTEDFDDLDDLDGVMFGDAAPADITVALRMPGPINAFREVIPHTLWSGDGAFEEDEEGEQVALPLQGWSQYVTVEKVDPEDYTTAVADAENDDAAVDMYPVRVTVSVYYQGIYDASPTETTRMSWIVLP